MSDFLLGALTKMLDDELRAEIIDGHSIADVVGAVDLDVAFSPVVEHRCDEFDFQPPQPTEVQKWGDGYALVYPAQADFRRVDEGSLRVMRARFLLMRGAYYKMLRGMPNGTQRQVISWYFPGGAWQPEPGSELSKLMGLERGWK